MGNVIGIVGGMGPYAGCELVRNILSSTNAKNDQEHIPLIHVSFPAQIVDRTEFLLKKTTINPAHGISEIIRMLEEMGANVIGIACNTSHAPPIFNAIRHALEGRNSQVMLVDMVAETIQHLEKLDGGPRTVGVISTNGTYYSNVYHDALQRQGCTVIIPEPAFQNDVIHRCIYDPEFGFKAVSNPVAIQAATLLTEVMNYFRERGADTIILGCTEVSFAVHQKDVDDVLLVDPLKILGRALIRLADPAKLEMDMFSNLTSSKYY